MIIRKLELKNQWICEVDNHSYIRTYIEWKNGRTSLGWYLNEDQQKDVVYHSDETLELMYQSKLIEESRDKQLNEIGI